MLEDEVGRKGLTRWDLKADTEDHNSSNRDVYSGRGLLSQKMPMTSRKHNATWLSSAGLPLHTIVL
jgi:hypothetical protein